MNEVSLQELKKKFLSLTYNTTKTVQIPVRVKIKQKSKKREICEDRKRASVR